MVELIKNWTVQGYYPNVPKFGYSEERGITQFAATQEYSIEEGDSLYETLFKNGLIENPMIDANSYKCEWVANRWWVYRVQISVGFDSPRLYFEAIDGEASVYINNKFVARHENSYVPLEVCLSGYVGQNISVTVMVENLKSDLNQSGYTSKITAQRPRYNTKWDFCPRIVSLGLVAPAYLKTGAEIPEVKITADINGEVKLEYIGKYFTGGEKVKFYLDGNVYETAAASGTLSATVKTPKLWYANGSGSAELYKGVLSIEKGGKTVWEKEYNIGFRTIEFVKNENAPESALPYTLLLNGKKTFIKGVNFVPVDICRTGYGKKYESLIRLVKEMNANFIRVWGGGTIETEEFYNLCDANGIMVWQDFMQSSSGIDNCATVIEEGLANIRYTAENAVKRIRNHPSLAVYCGGNELMDDWVPLDYSHPNIAMLKEITQTLDGTRMFLPTTASGPKGSGCLFNVGQGVHHDIHGPWTCEGNENHYEFYNKMDSLFHSEFGVDGFCNPETLPTIFTQKYLKNDEISKNYVWRHKAEWWDQMPLLENIFGKSENLEELCLTSQFVQAEALRYAVESNRRRAYNNSGCIVWQFNEPYPNLCCTNLVDYFANPKAAYYAVKQAYSAVNPNMKYDKLYYMPGEVFNAELYLTSDVAGEFNYSATVITLQGEKICNHCVKVTEEGKSVKVANISFPVPESGTMRFILKAEKEEKIYKNEILLLIKKEDKCPKYEAIELVKQIKMR